MARNTMAKLKRLAAQAESFIAEKKRILQEQGQSARWSRFLHFWRLAGSSFIENRSLTHASALAYTTLLALIPLLAIAISVSTSLLKDEGQDYIERIIDKLVAYVSPELQYDIESADPALGGSPLLRTNDVVDPNRLLGRLRAGTNALSRSLTNRLEEHTALWTWQTTDAGGGDAALRAPLAEALNEVILGESLHSKELFEDIPLRPQTADLVETKPEGDAMARLNRMLLEDAFPESIAQSFLNRRQEVVTRITDFIANIRTGTLTVSGTVALVFIAIGLLRTIEGAFNDIWGVARGRGLFVSIIQYWAVITLGPIFLVVALAMTSGPYLAATTHWVATVPFAVHLVPFVVLSLGFAVLYKLMPNTTVKWRPAIVGGVVGGCLLQLNNLLSFLWVSRVVTYSTIYGSLAVIPLFLLGLYVSWLILLFGAQVAYTYQNLQSCLQDRSTQAINQRGRERVGFHLMAQIAHRFQTGRPAPSAQDMADTLGVPSRLATEALKLLLNRKLIVEVSTDSSRYVPARPLHRITAYEVVEALRTADGLDLPQAAIDVLPVQQELDRVYEAERQAAATVTLEDLAKRFEADSQPPTS